MVSVTDQYDVYPYPERDPDDEKTRLIVGSPSRPVEMDHWLWGGQRDWTKPLRALVAGGGSGDGLVQLAQLLTNADRPYEITYIDLSTGARAVAEARLRTRGLGGVTLHTGSLLDAAEYGPFDYIDCCGVLHHLPDPDAGFAALRRSLAPGGGMGFMVYAPYGRSGVYPLQDAFGTLLADLPPKKRLEAARDILNRLPDGHPFKRNTQLVDHNASDAGFYDLLLHSQDRAFDVPDLLGTLSRTGWTLASFCQPALYDPERLTGRPTDLPLEDAMAVAEKLRGTLKVHVGYAVSQGAPRPRASGPDRVPHLAGMSAAKLARAVQSGRTIPMRNGDETIDLSLPVESSAILSGINGQRSLGDIAQALRLDPIAFGTLWTPVETTLAPWGLLHYSGLLKR